MSSFLELYVFPDPMPAVKLSPTAAHFLIHEKSKGFTEEARAERSFLSSPWAADANKTNSVLSRILSTFDVYHDSRNQRKNYFVKRCGE
jgi:hypothetical protein